MNALNNLAYKTENTNHLKLVWSQSPEEARQIYEKANEKRHQEAFDRIYPVYMKLRNELGREPYIREIQRVAKAHSRTIKKCLDDHLIRARGCKDVSVHTVQERIKNKNRLRDLELSSTKNAYITNQEEKEKEMSNTFGKSRVLDSELIKRNLEKVGKLQSISGGDRNRGKKRVSEINISESDVLEAEQLAELLHRQVGGV